MRKFLWILCAVICISCSREESGPVRNNAPELGGGQGFPYVNPGAGGDEELLPPPDIRPEPNEFRDNIILTNGVLTGDYSVPDIYNKIFGIEDGEAPWDLIEENDLRQIWGGFQVLLKNDMPPDQNYILTAKNSKNEFSKKLVLQPIKNPENEETVFGYFENIYFENKFWLSDGKDWRFTVTENGQPLIDRTLKQNLISSIFFEKVDNTPFVSNKLRSAALNKTYTFRCNNNTDLVVLYFTPDYGIYKPVLYILPETSDIKNGYTDIGISWNSDSVKGIYYFGAYTFNELPKTEELAFIFDYVAVE